MFEDAACTVAASRVDAQSTGAAPVYSKQVYTKLCILEEQEGPTKQPRKRENSRVLVQARIEDATSCGRCSTRRCV
jgi:hypothetical protein